MAKYGEAIASLCFVLFAAAAVALSMRLPLGTALEPMPGLVPLIASSFLLVVSLVQVVLSLRGKEEFDGMGENWKRPAALIVGLFFYSFSLNYIGYILATLALSILIMKVLEPKAWLEPILVSLGLTTFSYVLFDRLLEVNLPEGPLAALLK
jgi:hypothetical protein